MNIHSSSFRRKQKITVCDITETRFTTVGGGIQEMGRNGGEEAIWGWYEGYPFSSVLPAANGCFLIPDHIL